MITDFVVQKPKPPSVEISTECEKEKLISPTEVLTISSDDSDLGPVP